MRILQQAEMHRLWNRARIGEPHLRTVLDAAISVLGHGAAILRYQHRRDITTVGGELDGGDDRGQQRATRQLRRRAARDIRHVHVRAGGEVGDVRHLRTAR